ncbi:MAG: hypothetical protein UY48_C0002G0003 [Candidatus Gottesmanbacteria bacterium GW2011_GWB1_49_7]|uniref:Uncharacterized protein n=1 Tax=Candidatus Gottesmanbacteria bacterium GW2011_GWB1_49_7 TaxID=1618448 RepID=A0A0G1YEC3_9BACT|nr:MAG: hypothetical protein UY48_C0002G0003 [Candidatus Gottesmanbacteria bacterium GW2011_GWB1_49_7]
MALKVLDGGLTPQALKTAFENALKEYDHCLGLYLSCRAGADREIAAANARLQAVTEAAFAQLGEAEARRVLWRGRWEKKGSLT